MNLIVIKTDGSIDVSAFDKIAELTKSIIVYLPFSCTLTTGETAKKELETYVEILETISER